MKLPPYTILLILWCSTACNTSKPNYRLDSSDNLVLNEVVISSKEKKGVAATSQDTRMVLFSAQLDLIVSQPDSAAASLAQIAAQYNVYAAEISTKRTIIRVESTRLDEALGDIGRLGKVQSKSIKGQDVTDEYLDYTIRLDNATKARERYLELLQKAENVEATLKVERELGRLNETIDLLKGKINRLEHLVAFSTITIYLETRVKPGILGYVGLGLYHSVKWLFVRN